MRVGKIQYEGNRKIEAIFQVGLLYYFFLSMKIPNFLPYSYLFFSFCIFFFRVKEGLRTNAVWDDDERGDVFPGV